MGTVRTMMALGWLAGAALPALAAAPGSLQAAYDAAQTAMDKEDWKTAAAGFAPLLPSDPARPFDHSRAVIATRLSYALERLDRPGEAAAMARRAIAALPADDAISLATAWTVIGDSARFNMDYASATDAYQHAVDAADRTGDGAARIAAVSGLALTLMTISPERAEIALNSLLNDAKLTGGTSRPTLAVIEGLRARAAINAGDRVTARAWINRAIPHSGGLYGDNLSIAQSEIRGDAAIIAKLQGYDDDVRKYLTRTGAGHLMSMDWVGSHSGELPVCDADDGIRPDDSAVVEFALSNDGRVIGAMPVYASRPGGIGLAFARAISDWRWNPDQVKTVDAFWRHTVRFELRCVTRPEPVALSRPFTRAMLTWLKSLGAFDGPDDSKLPDYVAAGDPRLDQAGASAIPALMVRLRHSGTDAEAVSINLDRAVEAAQAPAEVRALVVKAHADALARHGGNYRLVGREQANVMSVLVPGFEARYPASMPAAWLELEWAVALERSGDFAAARPHLAKAIATPQSALPSDDPIRQVALLHMAMVKARAGEDASAHADLAASGLTAGQCALVDTRPVATNMSIVSSQFPQAALYWHFEGYVEEAFDIAAEGHVSNVRTVIAYPPYVFDPATERAVSDFRFVPPTIQGKAVGCTGQMQKVNYRIPS